MAKKKRQFALVGADNEVKQVVEADDEFTEEHPAEEFAYQDINGEHQVGGEGARWVETSMDGSVTKSFAGIGHQFHEDLGEFIPKKKYDSWVRDEENLRWKAPVEKPNDDREYKWDESKVDWEFDPVGQQRKEKIAEEEAKEKLEKERKDKK